MIELLQPFFRGAWARYGEALVIEPRPAGASTLRDLLADPALLHDILLRQAWRLGTTDLRPVASRWMLNYVDLLLPPVTVAASLLQHVLPIAPADIVVQLDEHGAPARFILERSGRDARGEPTAQRYELLLDQHLTPLITALAALSRVSPRTLWGNVARDLNNILDQAALLRADPSLRQDHDYLLDTALWDERRNPMFCKRRTALRAGHDGMRRVVLHRRCCLAYCLPGEGYCGACPLSPDRQATGGA